MDCDVSNPRPSAFLLKCNKNRSESTRTYAKSPTAGYETQVHTHSNSRSGQVLLGSDVTLSQLIHINHSRSVSSVCTITG